MSETGQAVLDKAIELTEEERIWLVEKLLESMPNPPSIVDIDDPRLIEEVRRRAADNDPGVPWEQVKAELLSELGQRHAT